MNFKERIQDRVRYRNHKLYNFAYIIHNKVSKLIVRTFVLDQVDNIVNGLLTLECLRLGSLSSSNRLEIAESILKELE